MNGIDLSSLLLDVIFMQIYTQHLSRYTHTCTNEKSKLLSKYTFILDFCFTDVDLNANRSM